MTNRDIDQIIADLLRQRLQIADAIRDSNTSKEERSDLLHAVEDLCHLSDEEKRTPD
jgi:hypothetical protein